MRKKITSLPDFVFIIIMLLGFSLMLYPVLGSWRNAKKQQDAMDCYEMAAGQTEDSSYEQMLASAYDYNRKLADVSEPFRNPDAVQGYDTILDVSGGIMGYITIPKIHVKLPIYHGTEEDVLAIGAGHLKGSSFPVGGTDTHAVICAHSNLPTARLFSDLHQMEVGDTFTITVLDQTLTYQVEEILVVLPSQMETLALIPGEDHVTLMTCTPPGFDTHRLLLRSGRIETESLQASTVQMQMIPVRMMVWILFVSGCFVTGKRLYHDRI